MSWVETQPLGNSDHNWKSCSCSANGRVLLAGSYSGRLYLSTNGGSSWTEQQPAGAVDRYWWGCAVSGDGSVLLAGAYNGLLYLSTNGGSSWAATPSLGINTRWNSCAANADGSVLLAGINAGHLYLSTNGGSSWAEIQPAGAVDLLWKTCAVDADGSALLAGAYDWGDANSGRLWLSTNGGASWTEQRPAGNVERKWYACAVSGGGSVLLAGVNAVTGRLWLSTNGGVSWAETRPAGDSDHVWVTCAVSGDGSVLLASTDRDPPWLSTNGGTTWTAQVLTAGVNLECCDSDSDGSVLFGGNGGRLYRSGVWVDELAVTTTAISDITPDSAASGGDVTADGGFTVTARGVCWNTTGTPTTADSKTTDGSGTGAFTSALTGLSQGVTYHLRAYATNSGVTAYGAEVDFETAVAWTGSLAINGGAPSTLDPNVTLALAAHSSSGAVADMAFSADGTTWSAWESFAGTRAYTLPAQTAYPTEAKTVYARFRDSGGHVSPTYSDAINLTTAVPPIADFVIAPVQKIAVMCTLWLDDIFVRELHLTGGSVTADSRRSRTRDATIEVAPDEELTHRELYDLLTTPGLEIQLARGFYDLQCAQPEAERERAPLNTVLAALGRFVIDTLSYKRSGSGTTLSVSCSDLSARISRARWTDPYQVAAGTGLVTALVELLRDCWPDVRFAFDASAVPDTVEAAAVFDVGEGSDPWADAANLAAAHSYLLLFDETGRAALAALPDLAQASPVFTFARGATAIMTEQERSAPLENVYNGVIVTGEGSGVETPVRGEAWDDDPGSPGYRWGPLGPAPMFYSSPLITTTDQAAQTAASLLAGVIGRAEAFSWSSVVHPGLLPLDVIAVELEDGTTRDYIIDQLTIPLGVGETMSAVAREVRMPW